VDARWRIEMFGGLRVIQAEQVHTRFRTHKAGLLLCYLALHLQQNHPRERLLELLWPDMEIEVARTNLSTTLSQLRRQLEPTGGGAKTVLIGDRQHLRLNPDAVSTDVADFDRLIRQARPEQDAVARTALLHQAVELYRGELLPGCYDGWATPEQTRCQSAYLECMRRLTHLLEEAGQYPDALAMAQRIVASDPYAEEAYQAQMRLLVRLKRPSVALQLYAELEQRFQRELGARPSVTTRQMAETLRQDPRAALLIQAEAHAKVPQAVTAPPSPSPPALISAPAGDALIAPSLPLQFTRFFGRDAERAQLAQLLQTPGTRLVTIVGPGGAGKTRLSIEVAAQLAPEYANTPTASGSCRWPTYPMPA